MSSESKPGRAVTGAKWTCFGPSRRRVVTTVSSEQGWHEIGGKRCYFRSRWEANYARYLEWLKTRGNILDWEYEPETFWFKGIKRGVVSYKPDFRTREHQQIEFTYWEVKGWMDPQSKTKLKRMAKYHPAVKVIVISKKQYSEIGRKLGPVIPGWVSASRVSSPKAPAAALPPQKP